MRKKLRSRKGLTVVEMMITVLLLGIMSIGVAAGVTSSLHVYRESTMLSDADALCGTLTAVVMDELRFATNVTTGDNPAYGSRTYGDGVHLTENADGCLCIQETGHLLLQKGAYTGLTAGIEYAYNGSVFTVKLTVSESVDSPSPIQTAEFKVRPK